SAVARGGVRGGGGGGEPLDDLVLLLDEAHQLPDRAREARSETLACESVRALAEGAARRGAPVHEALREAARALAAAIEAVAQDAAGGAEPAAGDGEIEWPLGPRALRDERAPLEEARGGHP